MPTDVKDSLPDIEWAAGMTVMVILSDPSAVVTSLVIHGGQQVPADEGQAEQIAAPILLRSVS